MFKKFLFSKIIVIVSLLVLCLTFGAIHFSIPKPKNINLPKITPLYLKPTAKIDSPLINETSGIVKSRQFDNVFWMHNDSGDDARLFAITKDGRLIQPADSTDYQGIKVEGAINVDWEDITADNSGNLIIGDCGNNSNKRKNLSLYLIKEPSPYQSVSVRVTQKIRFQYPDQQAFPPLNKNFDAEAIFWANGKYYILTKHRSDSFTKLYRLDSFSASQSNPLTLIDQFDIKDQVTAADASIDGVKLAVLTYSAIWLFELAENSDNYFNGNVFWLPIHAKQDEAICFDNDNLLLANEQSELFNIPIDSLIIIRKK